MGCPLIVIYLALEIIGSVFEESELNFHFLVFSWLLDWLTFDKIGFLLALLWWRIRFLWVIFVEFFDLGHLKLESSADFWSSFFLKK